MFALMVLALGPIMSAGIVLVLGHDRRLEHIPSHEVSPREAECWPRRSAKVVDCVVVAAAFAPCPCMHDPCDKFMT
jgi:hypothetical protein